MVLHVGIDPYTGVMVSYDTSNGSKKSYDFSRLSFNNLDLEENDCNINQIFSEIKNHLNQKFGCACFYVKNECNNEIRKLIIKNGLKHGFDSFELIDDLIMDYLYIILQFPNYEIQDNDILWVCYDDNSINIWHKNDEKVRHIIKAPALSFAMEISRSHGNPKSIFYTEKSKHDLDVNNLMAQYPTCQFFLYKNTSGKYRTAYGALLKAQITAKTQSFVKFDPSNMFYNWLSVAVEDKIIYNVNESILGHCYLKECLPLIKTLDMVEKSKILSVYTKYETSNFALPQFDNNFLFIFMIDTNSIYSMKCIDFLRNYNEEIKTKTEAYILAKLKIQNMRSSINEYYKFPEKIIANDININAVGIDLGTSRCCAAVNRQNGIITVPLDNNGQRVLPSYASFAEENEICGQTVVNRLQNYSYSTVFDSKRLIGKRFEDIVEDDSWPFVLQEIKISEPEIIKMGKWKCPAIQTSSLIKVRGYNGDILLYPEEISAALLKHIKKKVEEFQGKKVTDAVITVPASFTTEQQEATYIAGILAGWEKIHLLPEPVAAAFTYFIDRPIANNSTILLFDLGGGTLDVCVFQITNSQLHILNRSGDPNLGGRDFDSVLVEHFKQKLAELHGITVPENKKYKLLLKCQEIKENLSAIENDSFDVSDIEPTCEAVIPITRSKFKELSVNLLNQIRQNITDAINPTFNSNQIVKVLQVGGGCRMPMIKTLLKEIFPDAEHCCEEHPEEVVAVGAAYYAYYLNAL